MEKRSFFVVLPSNTPSNIHKNTSSHYKIDLLKPLILPGNDWEVCLHEISFVNSWNNIHNRINEVIFIGYKKTANRPHSEHGSITDLFEAVLTETLKEDSVTGNYPHEFSTPPSPHQILPLPRKKRKRFFEGRISPGRYDDVSMVIDGINKIKPNWFVSIFKRLESGLRKVQFELNTYADGITLNPVLAQILGFKNTHYYFGMTSNDLLYPGDSIVYKSSDNQIKHFEDDVVDLTTTDRCIITGALQPDIKACFYNIFVYTNIVYESYVGHTLTPLLRTVQNTSPKDAYVTQSFLHNIYVPVKSNYIPTIEILIADDSGEKVEFEYGKTIATLHFRKRQSIILE